MDILWIGIIEELKKFGFTNEIILSIKNQLLEIEEIIENDDDEGEEIEILNLAIIEIFLSSNFIYVLIDENGKTDMRPLKKALSIFHFLDFFFFMIWIDSISFDF